MCAGRGVVELLGAVPEGVQVVAWDGEGDHPEGLDRTEFWVPQVEDATNLPAKFATTAGLRR